MISNFFIERPIFANVIAIVTMLVGIVSLQALPIEQYPEITPPTVQVAAVYPGANAEVLSDTVAGPIEQEINGVEDMLYMSSTCSSNGSYTLTVTFEVGTDLDEAQVLVQNRVAVAMPRLPQEVQRQGVTTKKQSTNITLVASLISPDGRYDDLYLSNFATLRVKDALTRVEGVGDVQVIGGGTYGMRIWVNPDAMKARNLTMEDVLAAIREQNVQVAAGQVGQAPTPREQGFQFNVSVQGRLSDPAQFGDIIIKTVSDDRSGMRVTRVKDVARVELGAQTYDQWCEIAGQPAASLLVYQLPGANALQVAENVKHAMHELERNFPEGIEAIIPFDTTIFVEESIYEVYKTLLEAGVLVLIVILVFLQDWRATLIPATTVPVTIIGAFAAMAALGFSINMLTLFGLVLAIGIVVDDAIVIVENAVHHIDHGGLDPKRATIKAMGEVIGPVMGITLVLMAVFLPTAFLGGITGQLYRQFALTIAATAVISALNAVTLKPAQCAVYLRPTPTRKNFFYRGFNRVYGWFEGIYTAIVTVAVRQTALVMVLFLGLVGLTGWWFVKLPTGFVPTEDQGYAIVAIQLPDAASQERTREVTRRVNAILKETPGVRSWFLLGGMSLLDSSVTSNAATMFLTFTPFDERAHHPELSQEAILGGLMGKFQSVREAMILAFPPPGIRGLGVAGGFEMKIEDRGGVGLNELQKVVTTMVESAAGQTSLARVQSTFRAGVPQIYVDIDRVKAKSLGVPLDSIFGTMQAALGSAYVNDFNKFGKTYQVRVQADQPFRLQPEDIRRLEVRNRDGQMIPLGTLATIRKTLGPQIVPRYNLYPSATINGSAAPGVSSGQALLLMEQMAATELPQSMGYEWTGMSFQEKRVGSQAVYVFALGVLMVYLVLAAQYESWLMPAAVIMVVPLALLGTVIAVSVRGMDNNIYTQIGIVLIIALASKNAILIVEFARELRAHGRSINEAAIEASRLRFRPILMTSFAFILGIVPLINATGAGAASRRALGTAVFGGMIAATVLAVFFVPVFYVLMQRLAEFGRKKPEGHLSSQPNAEPAMTAIHAAEDPAVVA
ncbi:efflux RND transporter permease subunit [Planctellipticum variicoloris]|uniref:efflux RND transporter permease subunit n=1 Tax=Planctellipticum variicoloris TaxID=3064265 RepID=UPI00301381C6|nr:multidrug efflux RND transporter permease subunit [Planctomycetaceae bacterium SH412]